LSRCCPCSWRTSRRKWKTIVHEPDRTPRVFHRIAPLWTKVTFHADIIHIRSTLKPALQPPRTASTRVAGTAERVDNPHPFYCRYFAFESEEELSERHSLGSVSKTCWSLGRAIQRICNQLFRCSIGCRFCLQDNARAAYHPGRREPHGSNLHWFHSVSLPVSRPSGPRWVWRYEVGAVARPPHERAPKRGAPRFFCSAVPPAWVRPSARREIAARR